MADPITSPDDLPGLAELALGPPEEPSPGSEEREDETGLDVATGEVMDAFVRKDEAQLKRALKNFIRLARV